MALAELGLACLISSIRLSSGQDAKKKHQAGTSLFSQHFAVH
jgi:hypothetical protein